MLESNQVLLWGLLARAAVPLDVHGFGPVFVPPMKSRLDGATALVDETAVDE